LSDDLARPRLREAETLFDHLSGVG
jgi:hypothetical protein